MEGSADQAQGPFVLRFAVHRNSVDAFVRSGYLFEDESGLLTLGWRTHAEVEVKDLIAKLLAAKPGEGAAAAELEELRDRTDLPREGRRRPPRVRDDWGADAFWFWRFVD